jgi:hypothetical protein
MTYLPNTSFTIKDSPNLDAFGRLRISNPFTIFDSKILNDTNDLYYDQITLNGSITYLPNESSRSLSVDASAGNYAIIQTKRSFNYQPGKSMFCLFTGILTTETNVTKRVGLFDSVTGGTYLPYNGLYFENDGTTISINVVKNTTGITKIVQTNWNLDKLNGAGGNDNPSDINLDLTKSQIFVIDFEWLGVGRIRFGFNINGNTYYCHEVLNANNIVGVYIRYPNLPIRYEIRSTGGAGSMRQICSSITSEGSFDPNGIFRNIHTPTSLSILGGVTRPIIAIRLKATNRNVEIIPSIMSALASDGGSFFWTLKYYNGTETLNRNGVSTQWESIGFTGLTNSSIEYKNNFLATDVVVSNQGIALNGGYVNAETNGADLSVELKNALLIGSKINGYRDVFVIEILNIDGATETYNTSLTWREI